MANKPLALKATATNVTSGSWVGYEKLNSDMFFPCLKFPPLGGTSGSSHQNCHSFVN